MINRKLAGLLVAGMLLSGCHHPNSGPANTSQPKNWSEAMQIKMEAYGNKSQKELQPYFAKAHANYPPQQLAFLVFKDTKTLEVWSRDDSTMPWHYIHRFPVLAASGGPGPKLKEGDRQVPEGIYHIIGLNPMSHFDLSMQLDYPNNFDKFEAARTGRSNLGNDIFIHGKKLSIGCIALGNHGIEELFPLVYRVGIRNTTIIISPNDLRKAPPVMETKEPDWVPVLYQQIKVALSDFAPGDKISPNLMAYNDGVHPLNLAVPVNITNKAESLPAIPLPSLVLGVPKKQSPHPRVAVVASLDKNLTMKKTFAKDTNLAEEQNFIIPSNKNIANVSNSIGTLPFIPPK